MKMTAQGRDEGKGLVNTDDSLSIYVSCPESGIDGAEKPASEKTRKRLGYILKDGKPDE